MKGRERAAPRRRQTVRSRPSFSRADMIERVFVCGCSGVQGEAWQALKCKRPGKLPSPIISILRRESPHCLNRISDTFVNSRQFHALPRLLCFFLMLWTNSDSSSLRIAQRPFFGRLHWWRTSWFSCQAEISEPPDGSWSRWWHMLIAAPNIGLLKELRLASNTNKGALASGLRPTTLVL